MFLAGWAGLLTACHRPAAGSGPLWTETPRHEFGIVFEGSLLTHEWELDVRAPLSIQAAKTDCGCTLAQLECAREGAFETYGYGSPLEAGDHLRVRVRYDTRGRRGPTQRAVTLTGPGLDPFALTLNAEIQPWLRCEPQDLPFTRLLEGSGARIAFEVSAVGGETFALRSTRLALPDWVRLTLTPSGSTERAARWHVEAEILPTIPRGTFSYPLELVSDVPIPAQDALSEPRSFSLIPNWTVQVLGPVALSIPTLDFGLVGSAETVARSLRLESHDPFFQVTDAHAELAPLHAGEPLPLSRTAAIHLRPAGQDCEIELVLAGLDPAIRGSFLAKLVVETGHPKLPTLEALVRGVAAPAGAGR
jgi:hypothetical protein